ncbi:hypothetical protein [Bacillus sp. FJAT-45350]|uniref:hypothetical protein n=1 Tax=Bacillus sp. FJAT-45350 TaxID=2011014 RepID=UPI000BB74AC9|nr:hypothetical protein [Bacillus sp. FJAT-45350]
MKIPRPMNQWDLMFKVREEYASAEGTVPCAMHRTVCEEKCKECPWLLSILNEGTQEKIVCQPPVIWEE